MKLRRFCFSVMLGTCCCAVAHAQTAESPKGPGEPAQAIRTLTKALAGTWTTSEKYEIAEPTPAGGMGKGKAVWRPGPGGFTLLEEYRAHTPIGELFGFGLVWWDPAKELQHMWCINVNPTGCEMFPGPPLPGPKWNGTELVLDTEVALGPKKFAWHEVISDITPTSYTVIIDIGESRASLKRWLTSRARKVMR
jgi:hypothetical protein